MERLPPRENGARVRAGPAAANGAEKSDKPDDRDGAVRRSAAALLSAGFAVTLALSDRSCCL